MRCGSFLQCRDTDVSVYIHQTAKPGAAHDEFYVEQGESNDSTLE